MYIMFLELLEFLSNCLKKKNYSHHKIHLFDQKYSKISIIKIVKYYHNLNNCFIFEYIKKCNKFL